MSQAPVIFVNGYTMNVEMGDLTHNNSYVLSCPNELSTFCFRSPVQALNDAFTYAFCECDRHLETKRVAYMPTPAEWVDDTLFSGDNPKNEFARRNSYIIDGVLSWQIDFPLK